MKDKLIRLAFSLLLAFLPLLSGVGTPVSAAELSNSWWNTSWQYRQKLTFNNGTIAENLVNFPVGVFLTSSNFDFSQAQSAGQDIRFIDSDETTMLKYEIVSWNSTSAELYVKVPQINASSNADYIWMYWGNSTCTDGSDKVNVWDSNYISVYHMNDKTGDSTKIADSTSYNNYGNKYYQGSSYPTETTGFVGKGQQFDGYGGYIQANSNTPNLSAWTVETWFIRSGDSHAIYPGHGLVSSINGERYNRMGINNPASILYANMYVSSTDYTASKTISDSASWNYAVSLYNGTNLYAIVNAVWGTGKASPVSGSGGKFVLGRILSSEDWSNGIMDEVRISNIARSAGWISATNKSLRNTYVTFVSNGGNMYTSSVLLLMTLIGAAIVLTISGYISKRTVLAVMGGLFWVITGVYAYTLSAQNWSAWDIYLGLAFGCLFFTIVSVIAPIVVRERNEEDNELPYKESDVMQFNREMSEMNMQLHAMNSYPPQTQTPTEEPNTADIQRYIEQTRNRTIKKYKRMQ